MRRWDRPRHRLRAALIILVLIAGCEVGAEPIRRPWDEPVAGAPSVTDWTEEELPNLDGFEPSSPDELLNLIAEIEAGTWGPGGELLGEIAGENGSGTVIGFTRTRFEQGEHSLRGVDLRYHMRDDAGPWEVVLMERRYHCATETATDFCE
ncbi:MAG: hypothetical protein M3406_07355 [Chloroflexota bacterium]|nr:hypothetical protein [Chloroflexota bacterium]